MEIFINTPMNFAVLASTNGTILPSIFQAFSNQSIQGNIVCGITNKENCGSQQKLKHQNIPNYFINHTGKKREDFDKEISSVLAPFDQL